jgi:regulator of cell morphogenesis and NO signaling
MTFCSFSPALSVNDVLRESPAAAAVLNRFGIDTCCGGSLSLAEAAASVGVPLAELLAALPPAASPHPSEAS